MSYRKIKLVYVTTLPLAQWWFLKGQNKFLSENGFELHSITSRSHYFDELGHRDNMKMHAVAISSTISPLGDLKAVLETYSLLRKIKPDIANVSTPKGAIVGAVASWLARVPVRIHVMQGLTSSSRPGVSGVFLRLGEKITALFCNHHICVSRSLLSYARSVGILSRVQGRVLGDGSINGVDSDWFDPERVSREYNLKKLRNSLGIPEDAFVIGYVGRLVRQKGIHELAAAWTTIRSEFPETHLLLVGPWLEGKDAVNGTVRKSLECDNRAHLTGLVEDTAPYYGIMNILILPSYREGLPTAILEASAMALPVVATNVVGCIDALVDETGSFVTAGDVQDLAQAIRLYVRNPSLGFQKGLNGRSWVKRLFAPRLVWEAAMNNYLSLCSLP